MAARNKALGWRGEIRALVGGDDALTVLTEHAEGQPTAVWRIDLDKLELRGADPLPAGARAVAVVGEALVIAGSDGQLVRAPIAGGAVTAIGARFEPAPAAIVPVDGGLALLVGAEVVITDADGKPRHRLALPADGTALAASSDGRRLAAGTARGDVLAFGAEDDGGFVQSDAQKLHEGAVTVLDFDAGGATFLSSGVDRKLLTCHARGALEAEDRAGGNMHDAPIAALVRVERDDDARVHTAGRDGQIKTWIPGKKRPKTWKDGVARPVAAVHLTLRKRPHLAIAGDDNVIRLFLLDAEGQIVDRPVTIQDTYAAAREAFADASPVRRQQAIDALARLDDGPAVALLVDRAERDADPELRVRAVEALGRSQSPKSLQPLENLLRNARAAVREAALAGLRARLGARDRRPLELALAAGHADVGIAAVEALQALASDDDQALARLVAALDDATREVRLAAFDALEALHGRDNPAAALRALASTHADVRTAALLRFHQRELLGLARVQSAIRRASGDGDAGVRQTAFHVAVLSRPTLAAALRYLDRDLHRHLHEIEQPARPEAASADTAPAAPAAPPAKGKKKAAKATADAPDAEADKADKADGKLPRPKKVTADAVTEADRRPLLEAMSSRALDTCVRGALHLARLGDGRAFGTLLQLSRESDAPTRVDACRALADLGDPRSHGRLRQMLRDEHASVRDAAFSALADLLSSAPLDAADAGLLASHEDVRRRGLGHLVAAIRKSPPQAPDIRSARLLERALNDSEPAVRGEAFKALVNQKLFGGGAATLAFALRSLHASVRREVLTEVMGEIAEPWAQDLLPTLFDDPDPALRREAFEFARKRSKGRDVAPLARALVSPHADLRLEAAQTLAKKSKGAEMRALLVSALDDPDRAVRITAIDALEAAEAHAAVAAAMTSAHADVRVRAAEARAIDGDTDALAPLLAQVATPRPEIGDLLAEWRDLTVRALRGLAALADPHAVADVVRLLDGPDADVRAAAAEALGWSVPQGDPAPLHAALRHADAAVRLAAAVALARLGDATGASIVFAPPPAPSRGRRGGSNEPAASPADALEAAVALDARDVFLSYLDHADDTLRERALRVLLLQEMAEGDGVPDRILAALSSSQGRTRLVAADALARFNDPEAFAAFVRLRLTGTDEDPNIPKLDRALVADLAQMLAHGGPRLRARAVALLAKLDTDDREKRDFHRAWRRFADRFGDALIALRETAARRTPAAPIYTDTALRELVFGAWVGLSRLGGGQREGRIRQTALTRLAESGAAIHSLAPVLIQALADPAQPVRAQAFAALQTLRLPAAELAAEALGTGRRDVGVLGLELLAAEAGAAGDEVLRDVIAHDTDGLAGEATRLLGERRTPAEAWTLALEARDAGLRTTAVGRLAELADADSRALAGLRGALDARFADIRFAAAVRLAYKGDAAAFDPLVKALRTERQRPAIDALVRLGDPRTAAALLDRIEQDPAGDADVAALHDALARLRDPGAIDRLITQLQDPDRRRGAFEALRRITGFDQSVDVDLDDETAIELDDRRWLTEQHPRHAAAWARVIEAVYGIGDTPLLRRVLDDNARASHEPAIGRALAPLVGLGDDRARRDAVELIGWRLRHRGDAAAPLEATLGHGDPATAFLAAEQLALAGRKNGIETLLAAIDLDEHFDHRERAVRALGVLGDVRALDVLLRLVTEDGHALQEAAAEAIGRLAHGDHADRVFTLLARLAKGDDGVALHALIGLRWFGTVDAWRLIRDRARDDDWQIRQTVAEQLGRHDDPDTRAVLLERLREDEDYDVAEAALASLRRLMGAAALEPDEALMQSHHPELDEGALERLRDRGDPARLLALLPKVRPEYTAEVQVPLVAALLAREPAPVDAAAAALTGAAPGVASIAARILGRAGDPATHGPAIAEAATAALAAWQERRAELDRERLADDEKLAALTEDTRWPIWACGRLRVGGAVCVQASRVDSDGGGRAIRLAAIDALAGGHAGGAGVDAIAEAVTAADPALRAAAAAALAGLDAARAGRLAATAEDDRQSLDRLARGNPAAADALRDAARKIHAQGVVLPHLIARGDLDGLIAAAADKALPEATRLGAIEALSQIATPPAEDAIAAIGKDDSEDEALRKAAWRARRRAARTRTRREEMKR